MFSVTLRRWNTLWKIGKTPQNFFWAKMRTFCCFFESCVNCSCEHESTFHKNPFHIHKIQPKLMQNKPDNFCLFPFESTMLQQHSKTKKDENKFWLHYFPAQEKQHFVFYQNNMFPEPLPPRSKKMGNFEFLHFKNWWRKSDSFLNKKEGDFMCCPSKRWGILRFFFF